MRWQTRRKTRQRSPSTILFPSKQYNSKPLPGQNHLHTAPVTELSLPERIEEVLLPSAVRIPGFHGFVTSAEDNNEKGKKKKTTTKKKPDGGDGDGDGDGGGDAGDQGKRSSAKKRRKLAEEKKRAPAGAAPARCIAWNRYGTLLAGKRREIINQDF